MRNKLKEKIEYCGLNYKSERTKILLINTFLLLVGTAIFFITKNAKYFARIVLLSCIFDYLLISNYSAKEKLLNEERENEFVTAISYFEFFIQNKNNVYQSFNKVIQYSGEWMKELISNLLTQIDKDKTVQPFIDFAKNFKTKIASNIMMSIYTMIDQGESFEQINQFQLIFDELLKSKKIENLEKKKRSLSTLASLPLVGAALIMVVITIGVISIIGDLVNVI